MPLDPRVGVILGARRGQGEILSSLGKGVGRVAETSEDLGRLRRLQLAAIEAQTREAVKAGVEAADPEAGVKHFEENKGALSKIIAPDALKEKPERIRIEVAARLDDERRRAAAEGRAVAGAEREEIRTAIDEAADIEASTPGLGEEHLRSRLKGKDEQRIQEALNVMRARAGRRAGTESRSIEDQALQVQNSTVSLAADIEDKTARDAFIRKRMKAYPTDIDDAIRITEGVRARRIEEKVANDRERRLQRQSQREVSRLNSLRSEATKQLSKAVTPDEQADAQALLDAYDQAVRIATDDIEEYRRMQDVLTRKRIALDKLHDKLRKNAVPWPELTETYEGIGPQPDQGSTGKVRPQPSGGGVSFGPPSAAPSKPKSKSELADDIMWGGQ